MSKRPDKDILDEINLDPGGVVVTAKARDGERLDFVSRYFTPQSSILEDPVTGSAHCSLAPFWAEKLDRVDLKARQISERGGLIYCQDDPLKDIVIISGSAITYMKGHLYVEKTHVVMAKYVRERK